MNPNNLESFPTMEQTIDLMLKDRKVRLETVRQSHYWFFHLYFHHYIEFETADFQREMIALTEDASIPLISVTAFRSSAKSTIMNLSFPLWAIFGEQQKKFVIIVGRTKQQARQHLQNIKKELEDNTFLTADLGPFQEMNDGPWNAYSLLIKNYDAIIMAVSTDQSVRGMRHGKHRPDLIICDDLEDLASTKTLEGRNAIYDWVKGDLLPVGGPQRRAVFIGNLLHEDCLLRRLQREIASGLLTGESREYPLQREDGTSYWPARFPDAASIEAERKRIGNDAAWQREYLLRIIPDESRVVHREWVTYYDELPRSCRDVTATGVDLAIAQSATADYTAMVSATIFDDSNHIYVLPHPVNERLSFEDTIGRIQTLSVAIGGGSLTPVYVEDVGYQRAAIETLKRHGYNAEGVSPMGQDKRSRLACVAYAIQDGTILFPKDGCEKLIEQIVGFGSERHDDLADAFSMLMLKLLVTIERRKHGRELGLAVCDLSGRAVMASGKSVPPYLAEQIEQARRDAEFEAQKQQQWLDFTEQLAKELAEKRRKR